MHPEVISAEPGRCPECGMDLEERAGSPAELKQLYEEHVQRHEHGDEDATPDAAQADHYTCPMHPEIVSDEPGRCPICGMFLEQVAAADEEQP
jgi:Cu+-exporting ATPase